MVESIDTRIPELLEMAKRFIRLEKRKGTTRTYHAIIPEKLFPKRVGMAGWSTYDIEGLDGTSLLSIEGIGDYQFTPWSWSGCDYCTARPDGDSYVLWQHNEVPWPGDGDHGGDISPRDLHTLLVHPDEIQKIGKLTNDLESLYNYFKHYPDQIILKVRECWLPASRF